MLIVYEHNESVCCQKVRIALAEKSITDFDIREISFERGEHKTPAYLAINPKGVVPTIIHDGHVINESTIIIEYLDDAFAGPLLMPTDPYWRSRRRWWARWIDDEMHFPHISTISFNIAFTEVLKDSGGNARPPRFSAGIGSKPMLESLQAYQRFLAAMDSALAEMPWLAGPNYSLADIDVVPYIWRLNNLQLSGLWKDLPRIADWLDRVTVRPSFQKEIVQTALPNWVETMHRNGKAAWPVIERQLAMASKA